MQNSREARFLWITGAAIIVVVVVIALYLLLPGSGKKAVQGPFSASLTITAGDHSGQRETTKLSCLPPKSIVHGDYVPAVTLSGYALRTPAELCDGLKLLAAKVTANNNCPKSGRAFGTENATLSGVVDGHHVSLRVTRDGNCQEQLFASLVPLLPLATAPTTDAGSSHVLPGYRPPVGSLSTKLSGDQLIFFLSPPVGETLSHELLGSKLVLSCPDGKSVTFTWPASSDKATVTVHPPLGTCQLILNEKTILTLSD